MKTTIMQGQYEIDRIKYDRTGWRDFLDNMSIQGPKEVDKEKYCVWDHYEA